MPLVVVNYNPDEIRSQEVIKVAMAMPIIVAGALDVPSKKEARLGPRDIKVWVREKHPYDNISLLALEIVIWANLYPERLDNLDDRRNIILNKVRELLKDRVNISGFVWVLLQPASFGEI